MRSQKGFGLVEACLSLILISFLISALITQYLTSKRHILAVQKQLQESLELTMTIDFMRDSIRRAGFTPCRTINDLHSIDTRPGHAHLQAFNVLPEGHAFKVNRMSEQFEMVTKELRSTELLATHHFKLDRKLPIMIADCRHAEVQHIQSVKQEGAFRHLFLSRPLHFQYTPPIFIGEWLEEAFYVHQRRGQPGSLLYRSHRADELLRGVTTFTVHGRENAKHVLMEIELGMASAKSHHFTTMVRAL